MNHNSERLIFSEKNNDKINYIFSYLKSSDENVLIKENKSSKFFNQKFISILKNTFRDVFLPQGYPSSVSSDYIDYQIWDTVQAFCSTVNGTLTTHSIFKAVGVGDTNATALAATITWIIKDGTGMFGRISFAWWKSYLLDIECKKWRFAADIINDVAMCLELLLGIGLCRNYSSVILCLSTFMKAIVGVAGGATKAAVSQHQAIRGNMADVSAKDGSQETCVNLLASIFSVFLLTKIESNLWFIWILFVLTTIIHLYANYRAVKSLKIKTVNTSRLLLLIKYNLKYNYVSTIEKINNEESVVLGLGLTDQNLCSRKIHLGCSVRKIIEEKKTKVETLRKQKILYATFPYIILIEETRICLLLKEKIEDQDVIKAYYHAVVLGIALHYCNSHKDSLLDYHESFTDFLSECKKKGNTEILINEFVTQNWTKLSCALVSNGWIINKHHLPVDEWRIKYE